MNKQFILISLMIAALFTLGIAATRKEGVSKLNTLRIALPSNVQPLHCSSDANSLTVHRMLFDGLTRKDAQDVPQMALAEKITISPDKKQYLFHLRQCQWSDGIEVTAHDFEYSWKNALNPNSKLLTSIPDLFYAIKNAQACLLGQEPIEKLGVRVIDDKTLSVELEYPAPYFLEVVSTPPLFPVPKHIAEKDPDWMTREDLICNGPFRLEKWTHNSNILLQKNPSYWDQKHVQLTGIHIFIVPDTITALNMFQKNELDWIGSPFCRISYDISYDIINQEIEEALIYWFAINTAEHTASNPSSKNILANEKLRKALTYAIDRKSIVENVFHQSGKPTMSLLPNLLRVRDEPYFLDNNPPFAQHLFKEALQELGVESADDLPDIELSYFAGFEFAHRVCQAVQDHWRQVLGIKNIHLKSIEYQSYFNHVSQGHYQVGFMGWNTPVFDPLFIFNAFRDKSAPVNVCNWESPEFNTLLDQSNLALNPTERTEALSQAELLLMDSMPIIPLCSLNKRFAKNPKLKGEAVSRLQSVDFKCAYFEQ